MGSARNHMTEAERLEAAILDLRETLEAKGPKLRDVYALAAIAPIVAHYEHSEMPFARMAAQAYQFADMMLEVRTFDAAKLASVAVKKVPEESAE